MDDRMIEEVAEQAKLTPSYLILMGMSGILAAVALLTNSVPILVGSMVVAPALAPLALVAFALVGRRPGLALYGLCVGFVGILIATILGMLTTWVITPPG